MLLGGIRLEMASSALRNENEMKKLIVLLLLAGCAGSPKNLNKIGELEMKESTAYADESGYTLGVIRHDPTVDIYYWETELTANLVQIWDLLPVVYYELGIPMEMNKPSVKVRGSLFFETKRIGGKRLGAYLDCGIDVTGPIANSHKVHLGVFTKLEEVHDKRTRVITQISSWAQRQYVSANMMPCRSKGVLERLIAERVAELLRIYPFKENG